MFLYDHTQLKHYELIPSLSYVSFGKMFCKNSQSIIVFPQLLKFLSIFPVGFEDFLQEIPTLPQYKTVLSEKC